MTHDLDVLIVGAGPVGLALGAQLSAMDVKFAIIDQLQKPSPLSKAGVLWGRSLELLDLCMEADDFVQAGRPLRKALLFSDGVEIASIDFQGTQDPFGTGLMIPQNETESVLSNQLKSRGIDVQRGMTLQAFRQDSDGVDCDIQNAAGDTLTWRADFLVGCDGAHSAVRHGLELPFPGHQEPHRWILADVSAKGNLPDSEIIACWSRSGLLVMFRFSESTWRVIAEHSDTDQDAAPRSPTLEQMQRMMDERGLKDVQLFDPTWLSEFRIHARKVDTYQVNRVFLAGDAAHIHSPAGGQGMNTGIQDACNLAWKIAWHKRASMGPKILESYTHERSRIGDQVLRNTSHATRIATTDSRALQWARKTFAKIALHFEWTQEFARQNIAEYTVAYPNSSIGGKDLRKHKHGVSLGDRIADFAWHDRSGNTKTVYPLLAGGRALLLGWNTGRERVVNMIKTLPDSAHPLFHSLDLQPLDNLPQIADAAETPTPSTSQHRSGFADASVLEETGLTEPGFMLVRPDGYLAAAGGIEDGSIVMEWLRTLT